MSVSYLDLVYIIVSTVVKLMLIVIVGYFSISKLKYSSSSVRGIGYITLYIFLPCLLAPNIITNTNLKTISTFYWAIILSLVPMSLGFSMSLLMRLIIPKEYIGLLVLGCTFQNGLSFPLSITMAIRGLDWLDGANRSQCESFIFLYNVVCAIMLFLVGDQWVLYCKNNEVREQQRAEQQALEGNMSAMSPIHADSSRSHDNKEEKAEDEPTAGDVNGSPGPAGSHAWETIWRALFGVATAVLAGMTKVFSSPPVFASVVSLIVALVPPLRWLIETKPGTMALTSMTFLGQCSIPLQLIVQGCSMAKTNSTTLKENAITIKPHSSGVNDSGSGAEITDAQDQVVENSAPQSLSKLHRVRLALKMPLVRLSILVITLRLIVIPTLGMALLHVLRIAHVIPSTPVFIFAMLLEFCSPTALNSSLLCVMHDYHAQMFSVIIFYMYVCSIFTIAFWLFVDIVYIQHYVIA